MTAIHNLQPLEIMHAINGYNRTINNDLCTLILHIRCGYIAILAEHHRLRRPLSPT
ncbi:hypothetical protein Maes01_01900 [Microbulbifer aestuariivivens]|uniref:Uncharacterized protein n=1 Tax=Microbulbifer aestuariivivens TaxID=1908308 RepID=A0ABP9WQ49_9GAMM